MILDMNYFSPVIKDIKNNKNKVAMICFWVLAACLSLSLTMGSVWVQPGLKSEFIYSCDNRLGMFTCFLLHPGTLYIPDRWKNGRVSAWLPARDEQILREAQIHRDTSSTLNKCFTGFPSLNFPLNPSLLVAFSKEKFCRNSFCDFEFLFLHWLQSNFNLMWKADQSKGDK